MLFTRRNKAEETGFSDTCHAQRLQHHIHIWGRAAEERSSVTEALETEHSALSFVTHQISL